MANRKTSKVKSRKDPLRNKLKSRKYRRSSTAGKILPPLDVRSSKHLKDFEKRIKSGPLTIMLVYADWCGHCHTMMPHFDAASKSPNRSIQSVKVNEQMLNSVNNHLNKNINRSAKPLNVEGYPSIIVVDNKGNKVTDIDPVRNTDTMTKVMSESGPLAKNAGLNKSVNNTNANSKNNMANMANMANIRDMGDMGDMSDMGDIGDMSDMSDMGDMGDMKNTTNSTNVNSIKSNNKVNVKNSSSNNIEGSIAPSPINSFSSPMNKSYIPDAPASLKKEAEEITSLASPLTPPNTSNDIEESDNIVDNSTRKLTGGSLYSAMARTSYRLAPAAALLATASFVMRGKKHPTRKLKMKRKKTTKRSRR